MARNLSPGSSLCKARSSSERNCVEPMAFSKVAASRAILVARSSAVFRCLRNSSTRDEGGGGVAAVAGHTDAADQRVAAINRRPARKNLQPVGELRLAAGNRRQARPLEVAAASCGRQRAGCPGEDIRENQVELQPGRKYAPIREGK